MHSKSRAQLRATLFTCRSRAQRQEKKKKVNMCTSLSYLIRVVTGLRQVIRHILFAHTCKSNTARFFFSSLFFFGLFEKVAAHFRRRKAHRIPLPLLHCTKRGTTKNQRDEA